MGNFKIIYKILKILEKSMDFDELNINEFNAENLGISENRLKSLIIILQESGYISGVIAAEYIGGIRIDIRRMKLTLKGLEYLNENSLMKKAADIAKGIKETIPGL